GVDQVRLVPICCKVRRREVRIVQSIDGLKTELEFHSLTDTKILRQPNVEVKEALITKPVHCEREVAQGVCAVLRVDVSKSDRRRGRGAVENRSGRIKTGDVECRNIDAVASTLVILPA